MVLVSADSRPPGASRPRTPLIQVVLSTFNISGARAPNTSNHAKALNEKHFQGLDRGSIEALQGKQIKRFLGFFPILYCMFQAFRGLYYSQIANQGPRTFCNIFQMISGTSKIWSKSRPVDLLIITRILQTTKKIWNHP